MARVKAGPKRKNKHKKVLKGAKGHYGRRKNTIRMGRQSAEKAMQYAYRDRRNKKRDFRSLWIQRINAAARMHGMTYSVFLFGLKEAGIELDRKTLSDIAIHDPEGFAAIAKQAQSKIKQPALKKAA
jgi:large subunit ribosomal protein L20